MGVLAKVISVGQGVADDCSRNERTVDVAVAACVKKAIPVLKT